MRYEMVRPGGAPTKWFDINILPMEGNEFAVVMTYGLRAVPQGEDAILQPLKQIFKGSYQEAEGILIAKVQNREKIGYVKIEPTPET
jgi:hypothetical protein